MHSSWKPLNICLADAVLDWFYNRRTNVFTPLVWVLVGTVLLLMGLFVFTMCVEAMLSGRQYPGFVNRRQMSTLVPADLGAVLSIGLVLGGVVTVWAALCKAFPTLEARSWIRRSVAWVFCALLVLILLFGVFVLAGRVW